MLSRPFPRITPICRIQPDLRLINNRSSSSTNAGSGGGMILKRIIIPERSERILPILQTSAKEEYIGRVLSLNCHCCVCNSLI
nr:hypothetical protein Iba_chr15dCG1340 [Ipomoea batatas]